MTGGRKYGSCKIQVSLCFSGKKYGKSLMDSGDVSTRQLGE